MNREIFWCMDEACIFKNGRTGADFQNCLIFALFSAILKINSRSPIFKDTSFIHTSKDFSVHVLEKMFLIFFQKVHILFAIDLFMFLIILFITCLE